MFKSIITLYYFFDYYSFYRQSSVNENSEVFLLLLSWGQLYKYKAMRRISSACFDSIVFPLLARRW